MKNCVLANIDLFLYCGGQQVYEVVTPVKAGAKELSYGRNWIPAPQDHFLLWKGGKMVAAAYLSGSEQ